jgi:hypothetical protein
MDRQASAQWLKLHRQYLAVGNVRRLLLAPKSSSLAWKLGVLVENWIEVWSMDNNEVKA